MTPVAKPTRLGRPKRTHSISIHTTAAVEAERCVTRIAMPAPPSAASCEPPLKPNQPTHSMAAPMAVMPGLCGGRRSRGKPRRGPSSEASTSADTPAVAWTTRPPAKSLMPMSASQPPPQTQWQTGT